jgi:outer membrane receptor protein involved in Fe transport
MKQDVRDSRFVTLGLVLVGLLVLGTSVAWAQTETGAITGTITDPAGAVIPKATVTAREASTSAVRTGVSDNSGVYAITNLLPSSYVVTVEAAGMKKTTERIELAVGQRLGLNFRMEIGAASTTVEVSGENATAVNTETQEIGTQISSQEVMQLPTLNRNPYALVMTAASVSEDDPSGRGVGVSINGLRSAGTNVLLDGASNNDEFVASVGQQVPLDSLQEFSVITNSFGAEYGRATAGVVNVVTKSGSNNLHGSAYEVGRWSAISANTFFNNAQEPIITKPVYTRNQFGGSIGGPIKKDKLFFFFNPEWTRVRSAEVDTGMVADPAFIALLAPVSQSFFTMYGVARSGLTTIGTVSLGNTGFCTTPLCLGLNQSTTAFDEVKWLSPGDAGGGAPQNTYDIVGRVDFNITNKTTFYSRYAIYNELDQAGYINTSPYAGYDTGQDLRDQNMLLSLTHTLGSNLTEQTKFVYNRLKTVQPLGSQPVSPTLYLQTNTAASINGQDVYFPGYSATTPGNAIPFGGPQNFYQSYEDLSYIHGKHDFRFGAAVTFLVDDRTFGAYEEGIEDLGGSDPTAGINNLIAGTMTDFTAAIYPQGEYPCPGGIQTPACTINLPVGPPSFSRSNHYTELGFYGQDSWKVNSRLTLNLGLRWEYFGVQHNSNPALDSNFYFGGGGSLQQEIANGAVSPTQQSPVGGLWNKDLRNFAPRLGFAWDVFGDGKTAFRGGYGIAYERNFGNVTFNVEFNPPNYAVVVLPGSLAGPISTQNYGPLSGSTGSAALPSSELRWVDPNIPTAYAHLFSATLEHQFGNHLLAGIDYSGSKGVHQYSIANFNACGAGQVYLNEPIGVPGGPTDCSGTGWTRLNTQYSYINGRFANGNSLYNAAIFRLGLRNLANSGLTLQANYTNSLAEDDLSDTFSSSGNQWNLGTTDPFNPKLDWGPSEYSNRNRVAISAVWEVPFAKGTHGVVRQVADGWAVSPIFTARTGNPFTIYDCTMASGLPDNTCPRVSLNYPAPKTFLAHPINQGGDVYNVYNLPTNTDETHVNAILGTSDFPPYAPDMTQRDGFTGPGNWNLNLGIYKSFFVGERYKVQFRAEMFNAVNHANLYYTGYTSTLPYFSNISGAYGPNLSTSYDVPTIANPSRTIQATLRLDF